MVYLAACLIILLHIDMNNRFKGKQWMWDNFSDGQVQKKWSILSVMLDPLLKRSITVSG